MVSFFLMRGLALVRVRFVTLTISHEGAVRFVDDGQRCFDVGKVENEECEHDEG